MPAADCAAVLAAAAMLTVAFACQSAAEAAAHLLPSELVRLDVELGKPVFREDDAGGGAMERRLRRIRDNVFRDDAGGER